LFQNVGGGTFYGVLLDGVEQLSMTKTSRETYEEKREAMLGKTTP